MGRPLKIFRHFVKSPVRALISTNMKKNILKGHFSISRDLSSEESLAYFLLLSRGYKYNEMMAFVQLIYLLTFGTNNKEWKKY